MTKATGPTRLIWNAQGLPDAKLTGNYWDDLPICEQCGEPVDGPGTELADGTMIGPCCDRYDETDPPPFGAQPEAVAAWETHRGDHDDYDQGCRWCEKRADALEQANDRYDEDAAQDAAASAASDREAAAQ